MFVDPVLASVTFLKKKRLDFFRIFFYLAVFSFSLWMYAWEFQFAVTDLHVHAVIASEFNFLDLHSITSRLAYPMWHLFVSILFQLGVPLQWASALVCAGVKVLGMFLVCLLLHVITGGQVKRQAITLSAIFLMFVTGIRIPGFNSMVYRGVGSPTTWHNPTQLMVFVSMLLCIPYVVHCWYEFQRRLPQGKSHAMLPWRKVFLLAALLMFSLACKPTFMQAFLPACAVFFLIEWFRHPKNSRYFLQIILAFLPAALYFLLQYLYYTGVVVPFTSGVAFGATLETAWFSIRSMLIMAAFPFYTLVFCYQKGMLKDKMLVITLLLTLFSMLQSMFFRETGLRVGHGNFNWASMGSALMLWVLTLGHFLLSFSHFFRSHPKPWFRWPLYGIGFALLAWHVYSSGFYIWHLLVSGNAF